MLAITFTSMPNVASFALHDNGKIQKGPMELSGTWISSELSPIRIESQATSRPDQKRKFSNDAINATHFAFDVLSVFNSLRRHVVFN